MLKPYFLPSNPVFTLSIKPGFPWHGIMGNVSALMLCMLGFHPFPALSDQGFLKQRCHLQCRVNGGTYVSPAEQLVVGTDIKAIHA